MPKKALITNLWLLTRTGSELHVLEVARALVRRGWEVTCYALLVGEPLLSRLEALGEAVHVVELGHEELLDDHYDLLYAQHHVVSDFVFGSLGITFDHVIVSILSSMDVAELVPELAPHSDRILFVSEEAREAAKNDLRALETCPPVSIFPNYASRDYFDAFDTRVEPATEAPRRVAVISNHVPDEVRDLADEVPSGVSVDYFGMQTRSVDVTPGLLASYDVVVTIGRTVQQCMACGTPVFCYDHFGGPGYLYADELDAHAAANFSGRSDPRRRSAKELAAELMGGFARAVSQRGALLAYAHEHFDFDVLLDEVLDDVMARPAPARPLPAPRSRREKMRMLVGYMRDVIDLNAYGAAQVFYGTGPGDISQERSFYVRYQYGEEVSVSLSRIPEPYRAVRFDPDDLACVCQPITEGLVPLRPCRQTDKGMLFLVDDPFFEVDEEAAATGRIDFVARPVPRGELLERLARNVESAGEKNAGTVGDAEAKAGPKSGPLGRLRRALSRSGH